MARKSVRGRGAVIVADERPHTGSRGARRYHERVPHAFGREHTTAQRALDLTQQVRHHGEHVVLVAVEMAVAATNLIPLQWGKKFPRQRRKNRC